MLSTGHTFTICTPRRGRGEGESLLRHGQFIGSAFVDAVDTIQELLHINVEFNLDPMMVFISLFSQSSSTETVRSAANISTILLVYMTHFSFVGTVFARITHTSPTNAATLASMGFGG